MTRFIAYTLGVLVLFTSVSLAADVPKIPTREVVVGWDQAGYTLGWCEVDGGGFLDFHTITVKPQAGWLLCWKPMEWKAGVLNELPVPKAPFVLDLGFTTITDAGLKELANFRQLTTLCLNQTKISDAGLKEIAVLNLTRLEVQATQVTDTGLKELANMKTLRRLDLGRTKVTDQGVKDLQKALPNCKIVK